MQDHRFRFICWFYAHPYPFFTDLYLLFETGTTRAHFYGTISPMPTRAGNTFGFCLLCFLFHTLICFARLSCFVCVFVGYTLNKTSIKNFTHTLFWSAYCTLLVPPGYSCTAANGLPRPVARGWSLIFMVERTCRKICGHRGREFQAVLVPGNNTVAATKTAT